MFGFLRGPLPATPWFESDQLAAYLARKRFDAETEAFVRTLAERGAAQIDLGEAVQALCDQAVAETEGYFEGEIGRVQDAWYESPAVRKLATLPKVRRLLKAAFGRKPFAFQTLNFKRGTQQALHSDTIHFHSLPERFMCGVWIALEDIRPEAGPLMYRPGSHRLPTLSMQGAGVNGITTDAADYERHWVPAYARQIERSGLPEEHAVISKGQAFVWAANLAHGGSPISDPASTRRSLVTHYYFEDCIYFTPMMSDVTTGRVEDLHLRAPPDVLRERAVLPRKDGRAVATPHHVVEDTRMRLRERKPHVV